MPAESYRCFTRTWWTPNPSWPDGREPGAGPKNYRRMPRGLTYEEAQRFCREWNATHDPGKLSLKAEFEEEGGRQTRRRRVEYGRIY